MNKFTEITLNYNGETIKYPLKNNIKFSEFENSLYSILGIDKQNYQIDIVYKKLVLNSPENNVKTVGEIFGIYDKNECVIVSSINKDSKQINQMCDEIDNFRNLINSSIFSNFNQFEADFKDKIIKMKDEIVGKFNDLENSLGNYKSSLNMTLYDEIDYLINTFDENFYKFKKAPNNKDLYETILKDYTEIKSKKSNFLIEENLSKIKFSHFLKNFYKLIVFALKDLCDLNSWKCVFNLNVEGNKLVKDVPISSIISHGEKNNFTISQHSINHNQQNENPINDDFLKQKNSSFIPTKQILQCSLNKSSLIPPNQNPLVILNNSSLNPINHNSQNSLNNSSFLIQSNQDPLGTQSNYFNETYFENNKDQITSKLGNIVLNPMAATIEKNPILLPSFQTSHNNPLQPSVLDNLPQSNLLLKKKILPLIIIF